MTEDPPAYGDADQPVAAEFSSGDEGSRALGPIAAISVGVLVLLLGGAIAVFGLFGTESDPLEAIPADVDVVFTVDLVQLTDSERINALVSTFAEPMENAGYIDSSDIDIAGQLDQALRDEFDLSLEEDVVPWVGRSLAVGAWIPPDFEPFMGPPDVVLTVSIRDEEAAAQFIQSVGEPIDEEPFEDGTLYTPLDESADPLVIWVGSDLIVMTPDRATLREALDARDGASVSNDDDFTQAISRLPSDRLAAFYAGPSLFQAMANAAMAMPATPFNAEATEDVRGMAASLSLPDTGVQFDTVQLFAEGASDNPFAASEHRGVTALPADTIGYMSFFLAEGGVQEWLDQFRHTDPDLYDQIATEAEAELGVDLFGEVLPSIGGENLFAVVQDRNGMLATESQLPLGILVSMGLTDTGPVSDLIAGLETLAREEGIDIRTGNPTVAVIEGPEVVAYQITDDALVAGSSASILERFLEGSGGLAGTPLYQELNSELPGDELSFFVDMVRIFDLIDMSPEGRAIAAPIRGLGASYEIADDVVTSSALILIDYLDG